MEDKLDRELIARNLINIIDVKNCTNYTIFMDDEIYNILQDYIIKMFGVDEMTIEKIKKFLIWFLKFTMLIIKQRRHWH